MGIIHPHSIENNKDITMEKTRNWGIFATG